MNTHMASKTQPSPITRFGIIPVVPIQFATTNSPTVPTLVILWEGVFFDMQNIWSTAFVSSETNYSIPRSFSSPGDFLFSMRIIVSLCVHIVLFTMCFCPILSLLNHMFAMLQIVIVFTLFCIHNFIIAEVNTESNICIR